jgi:D-glycerate 3-kinase
VSQETVNASAGAWEEDFLLHHALAPDYLAHARKWYNPLAGALALHHRGAGRPLLVGVNGCQGSGKTTFCAYLSALLWAHHGLRALSLSLDDFYLTRAERNALAARVHPLLATRGVPGTHDMALLGATLDALFRPGNGTVVAVPRFDKDRDDRRNPSAWDRVEAPVDLVLLEGWCLGAMPQGEAELAQPVNALERDEDAEGRWRRHVNTALARDFVPLYRRIDYWVMLRAPSFGCVYAWRSEQEQKLRQATGGRGAGLMDEAQLERFIQFYQRLTEHCLVSLPPRVDYLYQLDAQRRTSAVQHPEKTA